MFRGGHFWTPITPNRGSILHAYPHLKWPPSEGCRYSTHSSARKLSTDTELIRVSSCMASVFASGIISAAPLPRAGQMTPKR